MSSLDEYGLNDAYDRVYSHNEVMDALQSKLASITMASQSTGNSELLSKVAADIEN